MTHHNNQYDPTKSVEGFKAEIVNSRYTDFLQVLRDKSIYRSVVIPDFIFLKDKMYNLKISYPNEYTWGGLFLYDPHQPSNSSEINLGITLSINYFDDDEFIKIIDELDDLINDDFEGYLDDLYSEVDDQARIDKIREALEVEN